MPGAGSAQRRSEGPGAALRFCRERFGGVAVGPGSSLRSSGEADKGERPGKRTGGSVRGRGKGSNCRRSEEHTSELQSLMRISYAVFCLKKKIHTHYKAPNHSRKRKIDGNKSQTV